MMKGSLITSTMLHAGVLAWMLFVFGSPEPFEVMDVESLPVDIVPIEEITQIQQGDKKAPLKEESSPKVTKNQKKVDNAENVGEADVDLKSAPKPVERPKDVETAAAPEKVEKPLPKVDTEKNDVKEIQKEETEVAPATEVAPKAEPKVDVKPEPKPEKAEEKPAEETEAEALPEKVPLPAAKPKQVEAKKTEEKKDEKKTAEASTAKTQERKKDQKKKETAKSTSNKESDFNADEIAALLNKQDDSSDGAKRSQKDASLGGKKTTGGQKLSQSEMDALRGQIEKNWSIIPGLAGADGVRVQVKMKLDQNGEIIGDIEVSSTGGEPSARTVLEGGARRAVLKSAPFTGLPPDKYDAWSEVIVNFDPSELM